MNNCCVRYRGDDALGRIAYNHQATILTTKFAMSSSSTSSSSDDLAAACDLHSNLPQSVLEEAYYSAAHGAAALQSILDGMDEALVAEVR
jgi:hypothetical protein